MAWERTLELAARLKRKSDADASEAGAVIETLIDLIKQRDETIRDLAPRRRREYDDVSPYDLGALARLEKRKPAR